MLLRYLQSDELNRTEITSQFSLFRPMSLDTLFRWRVPSAAQQLRNICTFGALMIWLNVPGECHRKENPSANYFNQLSNLVTGGLTVSVNFRDFWRHRPTYVVVVKSNFRFAKISLRCTQMNISHFKKNIPFARSDNHLMLKFKQLRAPYCRSKHAHRAMRLFMFKILLPDDISWQ